MIHNRSRERLLIRSPDRHRRKPVPRAQLDSHGGEPRRRPALVRPCRAWIQDGITASSLPRNLSGDRGFHMVEWKLWNVDVDAEGLQHAEVRVDDVAFVDVIHPAAAWIVDVRIEPARDPLTSVP